MKNVHVANIHSQVNKSYRSSEDNASLGGSSELSAATLNPV